MNTLKLKIGSKIPSDTVLYEGYQKCEHHIIANVGIDKVEDVFQHFIAIHEEPLFFILELPVKADDENEIKPGIVDSLHKDVYYIDGCSQDEALAILIRSGELLFNDGLISFGFGCHESNDEIMFSKYNVLSIYSKCIDDYDDFFEPHEITHTDNLITAWDTFSQDNPGTSEQYTVDGKTVYDIPEQYAEWGMYLAEQREE